MSEQTEVKVDRRKGNSGRKKANDPKIRIDVWILRSDIKAMGGERNTKSYILKGVGEEADRRRAKKAEKSKGSKNEPSNE